MVSSAFREMYVQMTFADLPGATEKGMLDLLVPYVKRMTYEAALVMTTKDHGRIHVLLRFPEPSRKEYVAGRFFRNVYSKGFAVPPGKKATDYISIDHKMTERDYDNVADVVFNDRWGPIPGSDRMTIEQMQQEMQRLRPMVDRYNLLSAKLNNKRISEAQNSAPPLPEHNHSVQRERLLIRFQDLCPSMNIDSKGTLTYVVVLRDNCPRCDHLRTHSRLYQTDAYLSFHRAMMAHERYIDS